MKRKILSLLLGMLLLLPATVFAQTYTEGYFYYEVVDGAVSITGYFGRESEVTVPASIAGLPVSTIESGAFSNSGKVSKINLPDTIMTIENGAFGQSQSIVYNSNTDAPITREPQSTQPPAGGDSAPEKTQQPTKPAQTPVQTLSPERTATPDAFEEAIPTPVLTPTPGNTMESPVETDDSNHEAEPKPTATPESAQPNDEGGQLPEAGFEETELPEDGTVEVVQSAASMPTPAPVPDAQKDKEMIVTLGDESGGRNIGAVIGIAVLVLTALAVTLCTVLLMMKRRRMR